MARPGISTKNTEKIPPGPKFWNPKKYPQNTPKIPKKKPENTENAYFWYFFGILGVFFWGSRISARGVFFRYFSWKFRVGPFRGSVAGRGVLNSGECYALNLKSENVEKHVMNYDVFLAIPFQPFPS